MTTTVTRYLVHEEKEYQYTLTTVTEFNGAMIEYRAQLQEQGMHMALFRAHIWDVALQSGKVKMLLYIQYPPKVVERTVSVKRGRVKTKNLPLLYKGKPIMYESFVLKFTDVKLLII